jgi:hypothetical protein
VSDHAVECDGELVQGGRRLRDLDLGELISWGYWRMTRNMDRKQRYEFDEALTPLSPGQSRYSIFDDEDLPEEVRELAKRVGVPGWYGEGGVNGSIRVDL